MAISVLPDERFEYVLEADREKPREEQTVFHLRSLPRRRMAFFLDLAAKGDEVRANQAALEFGLAGWDNFRHPQTGAPLEFKMDPDPKADRASNESLEWIRWQDWRELAEAVIERNRLTEEERKNSGSPACSKPASSKDSSAAPAGNSPGE